MSSDGNRGSRCSKCRGVIEARGGRPAGRVLGAAHRAWRSWRARRTVGADSMAVRQHARMHLPAYMVPSQLCSSLESIPRNAERQARSRRAASQLRIASGADSASAHAHDQADRKRRSATSARAGARWPARAATTRARLEARPLRRVLVVCYGNIYRSPFVGEYLRQRGGPHARGAHRGISSQGRPAVAARARDDVRGARACRSRSIVRVLVDAAMLDWADTIVLMDRRNWLALDDAGAADRQARMARRARWRAARDRRSLRASAKRGRTHRRATRARLATCCSPRIARRKHDRAEQPFFFARGDARLFGMLHTPQVAPRLRLRHEPSLRRGKALEPPRVREHGARSWRRAATPVLRFDYTRRGRQLGHDTPRRASTRISRISPPRSRSCARRIRRAPHRHHRPAARRERRGAARGTRRGRRTLAPCATAPLDPVGSDRSTARRYFQELLRSNLSTQLAVYGKVVETREVLRSASAPGGTVNVDGYEIGKPLFESCARPALLDPAPKTHRGPGARVQIARQRQDARSATTCAHSRARYAAGDVRARDRTAVLARDQTFLRSRGEPAARHARLAGEDSMADVEAVSFPNRAGQTLFGTLHRPRDARRAPAGRRAAVAGREDARRAGTALRAADRHAVRRRASPCCASISSASATPKASSTRNCCADVYNHIEVGRYVDDTLAALQWLRARTGIKRSCSADCAAAPSPRCSPPRRDPSVEGLLSLGMTVTLASNAATPGKYLTRGAARRHAASSTSRSC